MQEGRVAEHLVNEANKYLGSEATDTVDGMFHLQKGRSRSSEGRK